MKLVLRLTEKPRGENFKFSKLIVRWRSLYLEFSKDEINHINILSSFNGEKGIIIIDNATITVGGIQNVENYKRGQSLDTLPNADRNTIHKALISDNSVLTVIEDDWFELGAEFVDWYF